jgi:hypothetical protein
MALEEHIQFPTQRPQMPTTGSAGLATQCPGVAVTVSSVAAASGGIHPGALIETNIYKPSK